MSLMQIQPAETRRADAAPAVLPTVLHHAARRRMVELERGGMFRSDWLRALFMHFEVSRSDFAPLTPFELDTFNGRAFVSVVAFFMRRFRPRRTGPLGALLFAPTARHALLNVRTYVRSGDERGIFFLTEWIPNPISVLLGPRLFGLPYRWGRLSVRHGHERGQLAGVVRPRNRLHRLKYRATIDIARAIQPAARGSLDEFLLERHAAFTAIGSRRALFRIWHEPWGVQPAAVEFEDRSLLGLTSNALLTARVIGAHYCPALRNIWIGRPRGIRLSF